MKLENLIKKSNLSENEIKKLLLAQKKVIHKHTYNHDFGSNHIKIGIASDTHFGSKYFNEKAFDKSVKLFSNEKVEAIYSAGDILEGMSNREGQIYELDKIGYTSQLEFATQLLSEYKQPFYFITGNHDMWAKNKSNGGLVIGNELERRVKNSSFLGEMMAEIVLNNKTKMRLTHRGQTAYALSYPGQKMINSFEGGTKPDLLINGNLHKSLYMFYRNIHYLEAGTFQNQTEFMAMKGSPAYVGFWILDIYFSKDGIKRIKAEWISEFIKGFNKDYYK